jgi:hypothetical protein
MRTAVHDYNLRKFFLASLLACCCVIGRASLGIADLRAGAAELRIAQDASTVSILDGDKLLFRYRYADVPWKPCADQLVSPADVQVLRDSPRDHKHHHALMFGLTVDGVNFWEENSPKSGKEKHKSLVLEKSSVHDGVGRTGFVEQLDWVGLGSDAPLLVERRTINVLRAADLGATLVEWRCRLQTPPGKDSVKLTGNHYFGLGMRFLASMDEGWRFFNSDDKPGEIVRGDETLTATKWCAYTANADGKPVTVAIFDHPDNVRYPARMFTMSKPFAYLSATRNEWKEPLLLNADKPLELTYGVALWDGEVEKQTVEKLYRRWLQLSGGQAAK